MGRTTHGYTVMVLLCLCHSHLSTAEKKQPDKAVTKEKIVIQKQLPSISQTGVLNGPCDANPSKVPCRTVNSVCLQGVCKCANNYRDNAAAQCVLGSAYAEGTVDDPCATNSDCVGGGEYCSSYAYCRCMATHIAIHKRCLPVVYPGRSGCVDSGQCSKAFPGAFCGADGICVCPGQMVADRQTCAKASSKLPLAMDSLPVPLPTPFTVARRAPTHAAPSTNTIPPGGVCSTDQDCSGYPNSYCRGTCMCRPGTLNAGSTCVVGGSTNKGTCPDGQIYVSEAGACMNVARPGGPCQYSQQCSGTEVGAFCVGQQCKCVYGMRVAQGRCTFVNTNCTQRGTIWIAELGQCKDVVAPGAQGCTHRQQCTTSYQDSACFLQRCTCPNNLVPVDGTCGAKCLGGQTFSGVLGRCIPTVQPGDRCRYSSQCHAIYPGMLCDRGRCRCPNQYKWTGSECAKQCPPSYILNEKTGLCREACTSSQVEYVGECLDKVSPGQSCRVNAQCVGGAACVSLKCRCPRGMHEEFGRCKRVEVRPGGSCASGELCVGGAACQNLRCVCPDSSSVILNGQCIAPISVPPGSPCNPSVRCGGNSFCKNDLCVCPQNQSPTNGICQLPPSISPGAACASSSDRCIGGSFCRNGVCSCPIGTVVRDGRCQLPIQVPPGSPCASGELCTGLSFCANSMCSCPNGMTIQGAVCRAPPIVLPEASCANGERCSGNSQCMNDICSCPTGTVVIQRRCTSAPAVPPGGSCVAGEVCGGGSNCADGVCVCPPNTEQQIDRCQSKGVEVPPLSLCSSSSQCAGGSYCDGERCVCPAGLTTVDGRCLNIDQQTSQTMSAPPLGSCESGERCGGGSTCQLGSCMCPAGQIPLGGLCQFLPVSPGSSCAGGETCMGDSFCVNSRCVCADGASEIRGVCVNANSVIVGPGTDCRNQTVKCDYKSRCISGRCQCERRMIVRNGRCVQPPLVGPGRSCADGEICAGDSVCSTGKCICRPEHIIRADRCIRIAKVGPGYSCRRGERCIGGSSCEKGQCVCPTVMMVSGDRCVPRARVPPNGDCTSGQLCIGGSLCRQGRCRCPVNLIVRNNTCRQPVLRDPLSRCSNGEICRGGSSCHQGICRCPSGKIVTDRTCVLRPKVFPGQSCSNGEECIGASTCIAGICNCTDDKVIRRQQCVQRPTAYPRGSCSNEERCLGGSFCRHDICVCPQSLIVIDRKCVNPPAVPPGASCAKGEICDGGSVCITGRCQCAEGMIQKDNRCILPKRDVYKYNRNCSVSFHLVPPLSECSEGDVCLGGSSCIDHQCLCPSGQIVRNNICTIPAVVRSNPVSSIHRRSFLCRSDIDCRVAGAVCRASRCLCPSNTLMIRKKCTNITLSTTIAKPGQPCNMRRKCSGHSFCNVRGVCICPSGMKASKGRCMPLKIRVRIGDPCTMGQICVGGSVCKGGVCVCPAHTRQVRNVCRVIKANVPPGGLCTLGGMCSPGSVCFQGRCQCITGRVSFNGKCVDILWNNFTTVTTSAPIASRFVTFKPWHPWTTSQPRSSTAATIAENKLSTRRSPTKHFIFGLWGPDAMRPNTLPTITTQAPLKPLTPKPSTLPTGVVVKNGTQLPDGYLPWWPKLEIKSNNIPMAESPKEGVLDWKIPVGMVCHANSVVHCVPNSVCASGVCQCDDGFERNGSICVKKREVPPLGVCGVANNLLSCSGGSICDMSTGLCQCPSDTVLTDGYCAPSVNTVPPGASCAADERCGGGSSCSPSTKFCVCPAEQPAIIDNLCSSPPLAPTQMGRVFMHENGLFPQQLTPAYSSRVTNGWLRDDPLLYSINNPHRTNVIASDNDTIDRHERLLFPRLDKVHVANGAFISDNSIGSDSCEDDHFDELSNSDDPRRLPAAGEPCVSNCSLGAQCRFGYCSCPPGTIQDSGDRSCRMFDGLFAAPQSPCSAFNGENNVLGGVCSGGAECVAGLCVCAPGFAAQNQQCVRLIAGPGFSCANGEQCCGGSECRQGVCQCKAGRTQVENQCLTRNAKSAALPGGLCSTSLSDSAMCTGNSVCRRGSCVCTSGFQISKQPGTTLGDKCLSVFGYAGPGGVCSPTTTCTGGSICANGLCTCPSGEIITNNQCMPRSTVAAPNRPCPSGVACIGGSVCTTGFCVCPSGTVTTGNRCTTPYQTAAPGNLCYAGIICTGGSQCLNGICSCPGTQVVDGSLCSSVPNGNTAHPSARCVAGVTVCLGGSVCRNGVCSCTGNNVIHQHRCVPYQGTSPAGGSCATAGYICGGGSVCQSGVCSCRNGLMAIGGICTTPATTIPPLTGVAPGFSCNPRFDRCSGGSACSGGMCTCPIGYRVANGQCVPSTTTFGPPPGFAGPGDACGGSVRCVNGATCVNYVCTCPNGFESNPSRTACVKIDVNIRIPVSPGMICRNEQSPNTLYQCIGGSFCDATLHICKCPFSQTVVQNVCRDTLNGKELAEPGSHCDHQTTIACSSGSFCLDGHCVCGRQRVVNADGDCVAISQSDSIDALPGSWCSADESVKPCVRNSRCDAGFCRCLSGTNARNQFCVSDAVQIAIGLPCSPSSSICDGGAVCRSGVCLCPNYFTASSGRCIYTGGGSGTTVLIGGVCSVDGDCVSGAECVRQRCACTQGRIASSDRQRCVFQTSSVPPGSWCSATVGVECHGGAHCYRNTCNCPFGQLMYNLQCQAAPIVQPGRSCMNGELCGGGAVCSQGLCLCSAGTHENGPICTGDNLVSRAPPCNPAKCRRPDCYCSPDGTEIPNGLTKEQTPQMVILSFDDAVTDQSAQIYRGLFDGRFKNSNGCPIKGTFFVSHQWNDYRQSQWLYWQGHELAVNSITHDTLSSEPVSRWVSEMTGMRDALQELSQVEGGSVKGVRAPQLAVGGESQFEMMRREGDDYKPQIFFWCDSPGPNCFTCAHSGFLYDSSISVNPGKDGAPYWPQTLDYRLSWTCHTGPCPQRSYPGLWVLPINQFYGYYLPEIDEYKRAAMVRAAMKVDDSPADVEGMLWSNFNRSYSTNRAPLMLTLNADFLSVLPDNGAVNALESFLKKILATKDVWVVTARQAIDWMRTPTPVTSVEQLDSWQCRTVSRASTRRKPSAVKPCQYGRRCGPYTTRLPGGERWLTLCGLCPPNYPWLNQPTGGRRPLRLATDKQRKNKHHRLSNRRRRLNN